MELTRVKAPDGMRKRDADVEPIWAMSVNLLTGASPLTTASQRKPVDGVDGAFLVSNILSKEECAALVRCVESAGFSEGTQLVEVPRSVRSNDVAVIMMPDDTISVLSKRLVTFADHDRTMDSISPSFL